MILLWQLGFLHWTCRGSSRLRINGSWWIMNDFLLNVKCMTYTCLLFMHWISPSNPIKYSCSRSNSGPLIIFMLMILLLFMQLRLFDGAIHLQRKSISLSSRKWRCRWHRFEKTMVRCSLRVGLIDSIKPSLSRSSSVSFSMQEMELNLNFSF